MCGFLRARGLKRLSLRAPFVRLHPTLARGSPMPPLREPSRQRARNDAEHGRDNHHCEERRRDRERGIVGAGEWVERNRHEVAVGEGKTEKDDSADNEDGDFEKANHASLIRSTRLALASSSDSNGSNAPKSPQPS